MAEPTAGSILGLAACALLLTSCAKAPEPEEGKAAPQRTVHVLGWLDYFDPSLIPAFEQATGIRVIFDAIDTNATLEAKLMAGNTGYDVVMPAGSFLSRQLPAGIYLPLDKSLLPNLANVDPEVLRRIASYDAGNRYAVPYLWGTHGLAVDVEKVRARLPDAALDSWGLVFDPAQAAELADCGIAMTDSPHYMTLSAYQWLDLDPASEAPEDLARVEAALRNARPYVRKIDSGSMITDLVQGEVCVYVIASGDVVQARDRAREAGLPFHFEYFMPREGTTLWFDLIAIPADAPSPDAAHAFLNFLLDPGSAAANTNLLGYPNAIPASRSMVRTELLADPAIYPTTDELARAFVDRMPGEAATRARTRAWTRFMANDYR